MAQRRDEFPKRVQQIVAERAAYICSNPDCRVPTVQPHSDPNKSLKTGEAAHVRGAAPGGPRYDPQQTPEGRSGIQNAIWLCTGCSTAVDKDEARYPVEMLLAWKEKHEHWLKNGGIVPALPEISIKTLNGLTLPDNPGTVSAKDLHDLRENWVTLRNNSDSEILMLNVRIQFPEPVVGAIGRVVPPGIAVQLAPERPTMTISGAGTATRTRRPLPTKNVQLRLDRLPPNHPVEITLHTSLRSIEEHDLSMQNGPFADLADGEHLLNFVEGSFQFEYRGATITKRLFAPLAYDSAKRTVSVIEVREDHGGYKPVKMMLWS